MTIFYTECVFFRKAINEILYEISPNKTETVVVMDSRFFSSLGHMLHVCNFLITFKSSVKVIVLLNGKFVTGGRDIFPCGTHIQDSLSRWRSIIQRIIQSDSSLDKTIECLTRLTGRKNISHRHRVIMNFMKTNLTVLEISKLLDVSPKTVYGYLNDLKKYFHQPRISNLYNFIKNINTPYTGQDILSRIKTESHCSNQPYV